MRFKELINEGEVTLTLQPGGSLRHTTGGQTEEGFDVTHMLWQLSDDGRHLTLYITRRARDCDGSGSYYTDLEADGTKPDGFPRWTTLQTSQRDYSAEAAGY
jgi:hypothetical protein